MKKFLKISGITLGIVLVLIVALPFLFKDRIASEVDKALHEKLNAQVILEPSKISLSLIRSFPDFSLAIEDFGIINNAPFEGDTLMFARQFEVAVNFMSVIGGGQIKIEKIGLSQANLHVYVLPDGRANYDIVKPSAEPTEPQTTESTGFSLKINRWELQDINLTYIDGTNGTKIAIADLDHTGSGDFTQDIVDVKTKTSIADISANFDSTNYLSHKSFDSELAVRWNLKEQKGSFGENFLQLNKFRFSFSGDVNLGGAKPEFDVKFASPESEIKSLLSLVPVLYTKDFDKLTADGTMKFDGTVKGSYDSLSLPAFTTNLVVTNGNIQYPDLPKRIENLNIDLALNHPQGSLEALQTNIKNFGLKLGQNPFSLSGMVQGISAPAVDIKLNGSLDLKDILTAFPLEGKELRGLLKMSAEAKGTYNAAAKQFPKLTAMVDFSNGYVKTKEFPEALESIFLQMTASNPDGQLASTQIDVHQLKFVLANEPFSVQAKVKDLSDIQYDVAAKGTVDLEKMTRIFPVEGMKLAGIIKADLKTSGRMSYVSAKQYDRLPTSGTVGVRGFVFQGKDFSMPVQISEAAATFNSKELNLEQMQMAIGKSDMRLQGSIRNYLAYILKNETLQGTLSLASNLLNTNELMALGGEEKPDPKATAKPMEVVGLPKNIDFQFSSTVGKILYDNMVLENAKGGVSLKKGILYLNGLTFNTLDGSIGMKGNYNPTDLTRPAFDFDMALKNISISKAYTTFNTLQLMAPAAKGVNGKFTTDFKLAGLLTTEMKPDLPTVSGGGTLKITEGRISDIGFIKGVNKIAKTSFPTQTDLKDLSIKTTVKNGRVNFEPFDLALAGQKVNVGGSNGLDGTIDYRIKTAVPAGAAGTAVAGALSAFAGKTITSPKDVKFEIAATGPGSSPSYKIVKVDAGGMKDQAKEAVNEKIDQAKEKAKEEAERLKQEAETKAKAEADRLKKEAEKKAKDELRKLKDKFKF